MHLYTLKPRASADLDQASAWYDEQRPHLGTEFLREIYAAVSRICEDPLRFPRYNQRTRKTICSRFPYHIYFRIEAETVVVMALLSQQPQS